MHRHNMLHLFVGKEEIFVQTEKESASARVLVLEQNVMHRAPQGKLDYFLFIDATSEFARELRNNYLQNKKLASIDTKELRAPVFSEAEITKRLSDYFGQNILFRRKEIDQRVWGLLDEIDSFKHCGKRVSALAKRYGYSESYFTHLFKNQTGVPLKNYLLMRQLEFAWVQINKGRKITDSVMDAGFASPSHFADVCQKLMGISAADVLKKADL